jgi:hypothetical protein
MDCPLQAEQKQRTDRKPSGNIALRAFAPPPVDTLPPLLPAYARLRQILQHELLVHMCLLAIMRYERRSRFASDALVQRVLYLMGMALREEQVRPSLDLSVEHICFTGVCEKYAKKYSLATDVIAFVPQLLRRVLGQHESVAVHELCTWVLRVRTAACGYYSSVQVYEQCSNARHQHLATSSLLTPVHQDDGGEQKVSLLSEQEEKERRKKIAAEKRVLAQEQMKRMQQNIMKKNELFLNIDDEENVDEDESIEAWLVCR